MERSEEESEELDYWLSLEDKALQLLDRQSDEDQEKSYLNNMKDVKILTQDTLPQQLYLEKSSIAEHCKAKVKEKADDLLEILKTQSKSLNSWGFQQTCQELYDDLFQSGLFIELVSLHPESGIPSASGPCLADVLLSPEQLQTVSDTNVAYEDFSEDSDAEEEDSNACRALYNGLEYMDREN